jgi:hypothetical protein
MAYQEVKFQFPHERDDDVDIEIEGSSAEEVDLGNKPPKVDGDDIDLEIIDDTPEEDRDRKPSDPPDDVSEEELVNYSEKVRKRILKFSKGYHDERRAKEAALREREELERVAKKLMEENHQLKGSFGKSQSVLLEQAKRVVDQEITSAKGKYKEAYERGDSDAIIEAQEALDAAREKKRKVDSIKLDPPLQDREVPVKDETNAEPAAQAGAAPDPKAVAWANQNAWFGEDDEMTSFAWGVHNKLVKSGVDPKSDEYYEKLNTRMRNVFPDRFEEETEEVPRSKSSPNVVAPNTRSASPRKIRLTKTQVAIARQLGIPIETYARQAAEEMRKANNG